MGNAAERSAASDESAIDIDLIYPLSSQQRKQRLVDGYVRSLHRKKCMPNDIRILCAQYLSEMNIKSDTEIKQEIEEQHRRLFPLKIAILGAGAVGKTSTVTRFVCGQFRPEFDYYIEDTYLTEFEVDGVLAIVDILDTAGQEQFAALQHHWIRESEGFILMYDVRSERSFKYLRDNIHHKIMRYKEEELPVAVVLVGNKTDLPDNQHEVTFAMGQQLADSWNCPFFEASAKTDENVTATFEAMVREMRNVRNEKEKIEEPTTAGCVCKIL